MIKLRITWKYCLALYFMAMLYSSLHELAHHFTGYLVCGKWGYKTFNYFSTACEDKPDNMSYLATYAGPLYTFIMLWIGAWLLKKKDATEYQKQFGFAMIFALMPWQRMVMPFFKMNDEYYISAKLFGQTPLTFWTVIIVVWVICLPPLIIAYKAIQNKNRMLWFLLFSFLLPYILWGPIFGALEYLLVNKHVLDGTVIGIAYLFVLNEVVTIIGYYMTKKYFQPEPPPFRTDSRVEG